MFRVSMWLWLRRLSESNHNKFHLKENLKSLVEQVEVHVGFFLFFLDGRGGSLRGVSATSGRSSSGEGTRVGEVSLDLVGELERVLGADGNGEHVLVRIDNRVRHGREGRVAGAEGEGSDGLDTSHELGLESVVGNVQDSGRDRSKSAASFNSERKSPC